MKISRSNGTLRHETLRFNEPEGCPGLIGAINCNSAVQIGTLIAAEPADDVSVTLSYAGGDGGPYGTKSIVSTGVTGLTAVVSAGNFAIGSGTLLFTISGTAAGSGNAQFNIKLGGKSCTLSLPVLLGAAVTDIDCSNPSSSGGLFVGVPASAVSSTISYNAGNAGLYTAQSIQSSGVEGLTATLQAGSVANGSGTLTYTISGTPLTSGVANFAIGIGGQSCTLSRVVAAYPAGAIHCAGGPTAVINTTSTSSRVWMDRNLGASNAATSLADEGSYGDLYQWGRRADGHQCRNSTTTNILSSADTTTHSKFIIDAYEWQSTPNFDLWQGAAGKNNPCPLGYRVPTYAEFEAERASWGYSNNNGFGAFSSPLKLPSAGYRYFNGALTYAGTHGYYWTSTIGGPYSNYLTYYSGSAVITNTTIRSFGFSVRCIKD